MNQNYFSLNSKMNGFINNLSHFFFAYTDNFIIILSSSHLIIKKNNLFYILSLTSFILNVITFYLILLSSA